MKTHPLVENICVYGDPYRSFIVALVVPSKQHIEAIAHKLGKTISFEKLLEEKDVVNAVLKELTTHGTRGRLGKFELPQNYTVNYTLPNDTLDSRDIFLPQLPAVCCSVLSMP